jgi:hypothetical protein
MKMGRLGAAFCFRDTKAIKDKPHHARRIFGEFGIRSNRRGQQRLRV